MPTTNAIVELFFLEAWQHKITYWQNNDTVGFTQASLSTHSTYNQTIQMKGASQPVSADGH